MKLVAMQKQSASVSVVVVVMVGGRREKKKKRREGFATGRKGGRFMAQRERAQSVKKQKSQVPKGDAASGLGAVDGW
jgi:hypothetical protein